MPGQGHPREPTVAAAKRSRAQAMRRIFFLVRSPHRFYPKRPCRSGERPTSPRKCASHPRELAKVEGLVAEKSRPARLRCPAPCLLRLALTSIKNSLLVCHDGGSEAEGRPNARNQDRNTRDRRC